MEKNSSPVFTLFENTRCLNTEGKIHHRITDLVALLTSQPTGDDCFDYCLQISCDSYHIYPGEACVFSFFDSDAFSAPESIDWHCYIRGEPPCSRNSNCTPQYSSCGGSLPDIDFQILKQDLLSCLPNALSFDFESKQFTRKAHKTNNFFLQRRRENFYEQLKTQTYRL